MEISGLLQEALSHEKVRRDQAEVNIDVLASQNFGLFLMNCSQILCEESIPKEVRQISSTLIKNMILYTPKYKGQWEQLNPDIKVQIKRNVLSTLASNEKDIRKAAGLAVAGICKLELPIGEWQDIISVLCQTSTNENKNIQLASITTLGYISQEINLRDLNENQIVSVLSCLYSMLNTTTDPELQEVSISAMLNFIPFTRPFFENKEQKQLLLEVIYNYTKVGDVKIRAISIQCILDIGRIYYDYLEDNMADLLAITKLHMRNDEEQIAILAYEFWCSIADTEITRLNIRKNNLPCRNYCNRAYIQLLEIIFQHLLTVNAKTEENWNLSKAGSCLLSLLSQCCEYQLIQEVINFISTNISQNSPLNKEASILSFGAILETRHKENMNNLVINSVDTLINFLVDPNNPNSLKETTSWVLEKVAELYGAEFMNFHDLFAKLFSTMIGLIETGKKKTVIHVCNSLHHFSIALKPREGVTTNLLSNYLKNTLDLLLRLGFTPNSYNQNENVAMSAFYAIGSLIENAPSDTRFQVQNFFNDLIEGFKSTLIEKNFQGTQMRYDYQAYISTCIEPCLITGYVSLNFEGAKEIMNLILTTFKERGTVYEEGLMAASSVGLALGEEFDALVGEFGPFIIYALNAVNETSLCKTAIHSTSDLIRSIGQNFSKYLNQILPLILGILSNTEADKLLKPHSFNVITDVFITCKETAFPYFNDVMELIGSALEAATYVPEDKDDAESIEYFESLREHIVECLMCIFQTIRDLKREGDFRRFVPPIMCFVNRVNSKEYFPTLELLKSSLGLIGDFCEAFKSEMKPLINKTLVEEMIAKIRESRDSKLDKVVQWSQKFIAMALS